MDPIPLKGTEERRKEINCGHGCCLGRISIRDTKKPLFSSCDCSGYNSEHPLEACIHAHHGPLSLVWKDVQEVSLDVTQRFYRSRNSCYIWLCNIIKDWMWIENIRETKDKLTHAVMLGEGSERVILVFYSIQGRPKWSSSLKLFY